MKQKRTSKLLYPAIIGVLLVLYALYLWWYVHPSLYLIKGYREFFTDGYFFREYLTFPGRPVEYISRLLTQFYSYPLIATLLIFVCLVSIYFLGVNVYKDRKPTYWIPFLPVLILLFMQNDYGHSIRFNLDILALYTALFLFTVSRRHSRKRMYLSYPLLLAALFYLNGFFTAITFLITTSLLNLKKEKNTYLLGFLSGSFAVLILFYVVFSISVHDLKQEFIDFTRMYSFRYFPLILFATVILQPLLDLFVPAYPKAASRKATGVAMLVVPLILFLLYFTSDREERQSLQVQHYARNGEWEKTLQTAQACKYPDKNIVYYTNLALWHTGKMQDEFFSYNQSFGSGGLLLAEINTHSEIVPNQEIFLQMGALSLSIIWGTEATNVYGANSYVLRNLVKAYLAGGYIREAQKVLNQLDRTLFQKSWTARYREMVNDTTLIDRDSELKRLRDSQTPLAVVAKQSALMNLYLLSENNRLNKMAYDYLVIGTLLDHQMENFAYCLSHLKEYGYDEIPKIYLEGLIYNTLYSPSLPMDIREYAYDQAVLLRFTAFQSDLIMLQQNPHKGQKMLKEKYGDTYWYYILFDSNLTDEQRRNVYIKMIS